MEYLVTRFTQKEYTVKVIAKNSEEAIDTAIDLGDWKLIDSTNRCYETTELGYADGSNG